MSDSELAGPCPPHVILHTDLLDMKCTAPQTHCRFYRKDDKAGVLSKCLCGDRNRKSVSFEQAHYSVGKDLMGNLVFLPAQNRIPSVLHWLNSGTHSLLVW